MVNKVKIPYMDPMGWNFLYKSYLWPVCGVYAMIAMKTDDEVLLILIYVIFPKSPNQIFGEKV